MFLKIILFFVCSRNDLVCLFVCWKMILFGGELGNNFVCVLENDIFCLSV